MNCGTALRGEYQSTKDASKGREERRITASSEDFLARFLPGRSISKRETARSHGGKSRERGVITRLLGNLKGPNAAEEAARGILAASMSLP